MLDGGPTNDRYGSREFSSTRTVERGRHAGPSAGYRPAGDRVGSPPGQPRGGQPRGGQHRRPRGKNPGPPSRKRGPFWRELLIIVVAAAALTLVVKSFVVQVYKIPSVSMDNTLAVGDRVLVNRLVYHLRPIARGDVIVFSGQDSWGPDALPGPSDPVLGFFQDVLSDIGLYSSQTYYIKRVIGLPGDHVACCTDGKVTVNGVPLNETSYLFPGDAPSSFSFSVVVPAGHLWVMGDHRSDSGDSRYHTEDPGEGAIPIDQVVGRAFMVIWPLSNVRDLPIPSTFSQPALHGGTAAALATVAGFPVAGTASGAAVICAPVLLWRRRRSRRRNA
ncbi:MAG: signal peptidase I [Streptosporangiaceae bacterium]